MTRVPQTLLALTLVFGICSLSFAQDRAILYPGEGSALNGKQQITSAAVFSGDDIKTSKAQSQLIESGLTVQIEPDTSLKFGAPMVLGCGAVSVAGPSSVRVRDVTVTPDSPTTKYHITNRTGRALITVDQGSVHVVDSETETLTSGQSIQRPGDSCPGAAGVPPMAARSSGKMLGILGAGAAAGVACGILCRGSDNNPVSPSRP